MTKLRLPVPGSIITNEFLIPCINYSSRCCVNRTVQRCRPQMLQWDFPSNMSSLGWRHNERDGVSNHQPHDCLLNRLFRRRSKKTSKLRVTGLCEGNSQDSGEFPAQRTSNAENVSIYDVIMQYVIITLYLTCVCSSASFYFKFEDFVKMVVWDIRMVIWVEWYKRYVMLYQKN